MKTVYILIIATHIGCASDFDVWDVYSTAEAAIKAAEEKAKFRVNCGFHAVPTNPNPLYIKSIRLRKGTSDVYKDIMVQEKTVR